MISTEAIVSAIKGNNPVLPSPSQPSTSNVLPFPLHVSSHALIAAYLTIASQKPELATWRAIWPGEAELVGLPARWREYLKRPLPLETLGKSFHGTYSVRFSMSGNKCSHLFSIFTYFQSSWSDRRYLQRLATISSLLILEEFG